MIENNYNRINKKYVSNNLATHTFFTGRLKEIDKKLYTPDEISEFDLSESINNHPLVKKPTNARSKYAYKEILTNLKPTKHYILPGQVALFNYADPKFGETLEYYDMTPFVLSFGIFKTNEGNLREIGLNLHYYPPFTRAKILSRVYNTFKPFFAKQFNEDIHKPNSVMSYNKLRHTLKANEKIAFGVKEYIPVLRTNTMIIPTRLLPTAFFTEGHFSKATLQQIFNFWRKFSRFS